MAAPGQAAGLRFAQVSLVGSRGLSAWRFLGVRQQEADGKQSSQGRTRVTARAWPSAGRGHSQTGGGGRVDGSHQAVTPKVVPLQGDPPMSQQHPLVTTLWWSCGSNYATVGVPTPHASTDSSRGNSPLTLPPGSSRWQSAPVPTLTQATWMQLLCHGFHLPVQAAWKANQHMGAFL